MLEISPELQRLAFLLEQGPPVRVKYNMNNKTIIIVVHKMNYLLSEIIHTYMYMY